LGGDLYKKKGEKKRTLLDRASAGILSGKKPVQKGAPEVNDCGGPPSGEGIKRKKKKHQGA